MFDDSVVWGQPDILPTDNAVKGRKGAMKKEKM